MKRMQMTCLWLLMLAAVAATDGLTSNEDPNLERVLAIVKQQEHTIKQLQTAVDGLIQKNHQQEHRIKQLETVAPEGFNQKRNSPIAFTAALSSTFTGWGENAVVPYDVVLLNHGGAYGPDYNFRAPVRGLYWFTVSMLSEYRGQVKLVVNGNILVIAEDSGDRSGDAVSVMLMLEENAAVRCVKTASGHDLYEYYGDGKHANVFSGFLYALL